MFTGGGGSWRAMVLFCWPTESPPRRRSKKFGWCVEFATGEAVQAALSNAVVMGGRTLEFQVRSLQDKVPSQIGIPPEGLIKSLATKQLPNKVNLPPVKNYCKKGT